MKLRLQQRTERFRELLMRLRPSRRVYPTRAGWFALSAPFVLGLAAMNAGNNLLFLLLGACLGSIVISGIMSERALAGISIDLKFLGRVRAGERARFWLRVRRMFYESGDNPSFGLTVRERMTWSEKKEKRSSISVVVPRIEGSCGNVVASRVFEKRGQMRLRPLEICTIYPFGLLRKSKDIEANTSLIVLTRAVPLPKILETPGGIAQGEGRAVNRGLGTEIYGLRERKDNDSENRVHAMRSLALGYPVVTETEELERPKVWLGIVNDAQADSEAFERSLELATEAVLEWTRLGHAVGLYVGTRICSPEVYGVEELLNEIALMLREDSSSSARLVSSDAMWLVPDGAPQPVGASRCLLIDSKGNVRLC